MSNKDQLEILLKKPVWTAAEKKWLLNFLKNSDEPALKDLMHHLYLNDLADKTQIDPAISEKLLTSVHQLAGIHKKSGKSKWVRMWTLRIGAASVMGLLALSTYLLVKNKSKKNIVHTNAHSRKYKNDVNPGGDKAVLTLADGSTIVLDDANNGNLTQQGNTRVIKLDGKLNYNASRRNTGEILYNTLTTPRGGQYQVVLPDGSLVWLNAASSLRFPTFFAGKERRVEISGEVYFEVAKNKAMPFVVALDAGEIQVTGTHFNVMSYHDESTLQTTLLEGAVKFATGTNSALLRPGQQSQLSKNGQLEIVNDVDIEKIVAWKNGFFDFEDSGFETIAKQLSRWYNVEVVYERKIDDLFFAAIPRDTKLSDVLKALELTGKVHFEIDGQKIIVLP